MILGVQEQNKLVIRPGSCPPGTYSFADGNEPEAPGGDSGAEADRGTSALELAEARVRDRAQH